MGDRESTVRSRELGEGLRDAMRKAELNNREVAHQLGWVESRVSRMLSGTRRAREIDVAALLALCRVTGKERDRLLGLCPQLTTRGWLQQHGERLPEQLRTLAQLEQEAVRIFDFQPMVVTGMLQTEDYARALLHGTGTLPAEEIESRVRARMARQAMLHRDTRCHFVFHVHEFALRLPVGGDEVMSEQLHHLLRLSVRPYVTIRVTPASAGPHAGIAGAFKFMEFAEFKPVVYLDSETSSLFLESRQEVDAHRLILRKLADTALDEPQSRDLIAGLAIDLYGQREDRDELGEAGHHDLAEEQPQH